MGREGGVECFCEGGGVGGDFLAVESCEEGMVWSVGGDFWVAGL